MPPSLPPVPKESVPSFYYFSLWNCGVYYLVEPDVVGPYLAGTGLTPATFEDRACVSFNFQLYTSQFPEFASVTMETELNIAVAPAALAAAVPATTFRGFLSGDEQTRIVGNHHVHVPCDNPHAVEAGRAQFGEPKFLTTFTVKVPSLNDPGVRAWQFTCHDPASTSTPIFSCAVDVRGLDQVPGNFSPITEYGIADGRLIAARWNIYQPMRTYFLGADATARVKLGYGPSPHPMRQDMQKLIGDRPAVAVTTLESLPVAVQSRAFYS